jgi:hypothetical protein
MRIYCYQCEKDWDESVHLLLFAAREAVQESLGFSPIELVFGHTVRGPLKLLKEKWQTGISSFNLLDYLISCCLSRIRTLISYNLSKRALRSVEAAKVGECFYIKDVIRCI